jgi:hypothetical protein
MCSSQQMLIKLATILNKLGDSLRLDLQPPEGLGSNPFSRAMDRALFARCHLLPVDLIPRSCTPNPAPPPPHARGQGGITRESSASQPPVVFRPYPPWVVGAGSGRVPGPKFAAGTAAGAASGFLGHREGQKPVGFCPLGGAHQARGHYTLCSAIHRAEGVRRVRNGDFWKCV